MNDEDKTLQLLGDLVSRLRITRADKQELVASMLSMVEDLVLSDPMLYARSNYRDIIIEEITDLVCLQMTDVFPSHTDYFIVDILPKLIEEALYIYNMFFSPKREYGNTFIRVKPNTEKMATKIDYLSNVPQPDQRTDEWYIFRHKYLTASSLWKVFSTPGSRNQLIYDKCKPLDTNKYKGFSTTSPMHWGHKYEPVSIMWYEEKFNTTVSDFGCIPHKTIEYIAASPDGINTCPKSDRYGRMLEVKNIVNREITGIPKPEYWIQMQIQMEVCELNECDFLETRFVEYECKEDFEEDGSFQYTKDGKHKGVIIFFIKEEQPHYEYAPFMCTREEYSKWEKETMDKNKNFTWVQNLYWKMEEISCVLVLRNKTWFSGAKPVLDKFWETIQREKKGDYTHRAPKKRQRSELSPMIAPSKCMINIDTLTLPETTTQINANTQINDSSKIVSVQEIASKQEHPTNRIINISTESFSKHNYSQKADDS